MKTSAKYFGLAVGL